MAQQFRVLTSVPGDKNSVPSTAIRELMKVWNSSSTAHLRSQRTHANICAYADTHTHTHTHTHTNKIDLLKIRKQPGLILVKLILKSKAIHSSQSTGYLISFRSLHSHNKRE